jgi:hypothetical protein
MHNKSNSCINTFKSNNNDISNNNNNTTKDFLIRNLINKNNTTFLKFSDFIKANNNNELIRQINENKNEKKY